MSFLPPNEVYVIAEMANSHEGRLDTALAICEAAAHAGAHAIKAQVFTADEVAVPSNPNYDLYKRLEMSAEQWAEFIALARKRSLMVFCDVEGFASADMMNALNVDGFKVHASDTKNRPLLKKMAGFGKPVFLSTGGSTWMEIAESIEFLNSSGAAEIILMHGIQNYPTRLSDSSLRRLHFLRERFGLPLGYAPHVDGASPWAIELPLLAAAAGAQALEIHVTMDRSVKGLDYYSALEPKEFAQLTQR
ncbi:MAG: N-acetylneuraminate synthase family protein, partial [Candidatus Sumerlaeota bacterium]|nr:N-acetylneuraminate synthase family protein [Candidatus Sumerlaeota bacterium]